MRQPQSTSASGVISIDRASRHSIAEQIRRAIASQIAAGTFKPGARLPSTRHLSASLGVSRTTVSEAFDLLLADGLIEGHAGSGTYVSTSRRPVEAVASADRGSAGAAGKGSTQVSQAFTWGPGLDHFPFDAWQDIAARQAPRVKELSQEGEPAGYRPLRELIADFSRRRRGIDCYADQVIITAGMTQGLDLVARTLLRPDDVALVEDPAERRVTTTLTLAGARLLRVPVDGEGMAIGEIDDAPFRLAHVSGVRQFPSGVPMSARREAALRQRLDAHGAYLIDMENTFLVGSPRKPLAASQGVDQSRTVYLATFSWVLFRALRIGYVIAPKPVVAQLLATRFATDFKPPLFEQMMLEQFMRDGHYEAYVDRLHDILASRRDALIAAWPGDLPKGIDLSPGSGGLGHMLRLPDGADVPDLLGRAAAMGVAPRDVSEWFADRNKRALLLGFSQAGQATTVRGVQALVGLLRTTFGA